MDQKKKKDNKVESEDFKTKYLRALADYHNFEKRVQDERTELIKYATKGLVLRLLTFLDNLNQAEVFIKDEGLALIKKQFEQLLENEGLKEIDILNKEYNPHVAEAVDTKEGEEDDRVIEILQKGYEFNGKIVRPAKVIVSKKIKS